MRMKGMKKLQGKKLLLMGSKAYKKKKLPPKIRKLLDEAMDSKMSIIVGEAPGSNRAFQDYLKSKNYSKVTVGHARSIRYNAGNWKTFQYGDNVHERESRMISDCDSAIILWVDTSSVIAENLERLKISKKPTFIYEYSNTTESEKSGWLDPSRIYDPYFFWKKYKREKKHHKEQNK
jgi:hypothetical protein